MLICSKRQLLLNIFETSGCDNPLPVVPFSRTNYGTEIIIALYVILLIDENAVIDILI